MEEREKKVEKLICRDIVYGQSQYFRKVRAAD